MFLNVLSIETEVQVTVFIEIKTVIMVSCDFHHYNKIRKSWSLCEARLDPTLRAMALNEF